MAKADFDQRKRELLEAIGSESRGHSSETDYWKARAEAVRNAGNGDTPLDRAMSYFFRPTPDMRENVRWLLEHTERPWERGRRARKK